MHQEQNSPPLSLGGGYEPTLQGTSRAGPGEENDMYLISDLQMKAGFIKDFRGRGGVAAQGGGLA